MKFIIFLAFLTLLIHASLPNPLKSILPKDARRLWISNNKDKISVIQKRYRDKVKDKYKEYYRVYYKEHRDRINARTK